MIKIYPDHPVNPVKKGNSYTIKLSKKYKIKGRLRLQGAEANRDSGSAGIDFPA